MFAIVQLAKFLIPADMTKAVLWSLKRKEVLLFLLSLALLLTAGMIIVYSFNLASTFVMGRAEKAFIVGQTQTRMLCVDPDRPDRGVWDHDYGPFTVHKRSYYPGQRFNAALGQSLFVHLPGSPHQWVVPHHFAYYLFTHLIAALFILLAFLSTCVFLMQYSVDMKAMSQLTQGSDWAALFLAKTGISLPKALGLMGLAAIGLSAAYSIIDNRYDPLWEEMKAPFEDWNRQLVGKTRAGARLKGRVVNKETFTVPGSGSVEKERRTGVNRMGTNYFAYLVEFKGLIPHHPIHVSVTEYGEAGTTDAETLKRVERLDSLHASGAEAEFIVSDTTAISPAP